MMQIVIEDSEKAAILKLLVNEDINVLKQAYAYAKNLELYGVDVSEKWETVTEQCRVLQRAYLKGCSDERKKIIDDISRDAINKAIDNLCDIREERPIKQVTCKDCKNLQNDWGTLRCDYTGDIVDEEWYCKAAKAREVTDE